MSTAPRVTRTLKDGTACTVRSAEIADARALVEMLRELTQDSEWTAVEPDEFSRTATHQATQIDEFLARGNCLLLVAEVGGHLVGELAFRGGRLRRFQHSGEVGLSVRCGWRRRGIARALMQTLLEWARHHPDIEKIELKVFANNAAALGLYTSLGFREVGRRARHIHIAPDRFVDDLILERFVDC